MNSVLLALIFPSILSGHLGQLVNLFCMMFVVDGEGHAGCSSH